QSCICERRFSNVLIHQALTHSALQHIAIVLQVAIDGSGLSRVGTSAKATGPTGCAARSWSASATRLILLDLSSHVRGLRNADGIVGQFLEKVLDLSLA